MRGWRASAAQETERAPGRRFRKRFDDKPASPASDMEPIHDRGKALVQLSRPFAALIDGKIDPRVQIKQKALELEPPVVALIGNQSVTLHTTP